jgi:hypothetical protein
VLLALPIAYGISGPVQPTATSAASATIWSDGPVQRLHLGAVAIGYTLVYGIIELINFAHGRSS